MKLFDRLIDHIANRVLDRLNDRRPKQLGSINLNVQPKIDALRYGAAARDIARQQASQYSSGQR